MDKKIVKILFIIITVIYVIIGGLLFINIQVLESPEIIIEIEVTEINSEEAVIHSEINIENTNSFDMSVKNLEMITTTNNLNTTINYLENTLPSYQKLIVAKYAALYSKE